MPINRIKASNTRLLIDEINKVVEDYGPALGVRNFSEATERALRLWLAYVRRNEEKLKRMMESMRY